MFEGLKKSENVELMTVKDRIPAAFWKTYSAFANTSGGTIYLEIGEVDSNNQIVGPGHRSQMVKAILDTAGNLSRVSHNVLSGDSVKVETIGGYDAIVVSIPACPPETKPVYLNGNPALCYERDGTKDRQMDLSKVLGLFFSSSRLRKVDGPNPYGVLLEDLDQRCLARYRSLYDRLFPTNHLKRLSMADFCAGLGITRKARDGYVPTTEAILMFAPCWLISQFYPNFYLDFQMLSARDEKPVLRISSDDGIWSGNVFDFYLKVSDELFHRLPSPYLLVNGVDRGRDTLVEAVIEGVVNSLNNADFQHGTSVRIVLDGRGISIENSGSMGINLEEAFEGGRSNPRNRGIVSFFRSVKIGDLAGTGIRKMMAALRSLQMSEPFYQTDNVSFVSVYISFAKGLSQEEKKVFAALNKLGAAGIKDLVAETGYSRYQTNAALVKLMNAGLVRTNGAATKGRTYAIIGRHAKI